MTHQDIAALPSCSQTLDSGTTCWFIRVTTTSAYRSADSDTVQCSEEQICDPSLKSVRGEKSLKAACETRDTCDFGNYTLTHAFTLSLHEPELCVIQTFSLCRLFLCTTVWFQTRRYQSQSRNTSSTNFKNYK